MFSHNQDPEQAYSVDRVAVRAFSLPYVINSHKGDDGEAFDDQRVTVEPLSSAKLALRPHYASIQREAYVKEETMISTREHMTMATVGGIVGAVLGAGLGGALFGLPGLVATAVLAGIGGAFFGSFM